MHCIVNILLIFPVLRVNGVPSGLKIISGRNAMGNEYPFIVRLERQITVAFGGKIETEDNVHICTCAVLAPSWTLTAGHCIHSTGPIKDLTNNLRIKSVVRYGAQDNVTAEVISTIRHPSFKDRVLDMQNDIGLLRTAIIRLKKYAHLSALDINTLGGLELVLVSHENSNTSLGISTDTLDLRKPLQVLNVVVVRYDTKNESSLSAACVTRRCVPSSINTCSASSGGVVLHSTGVIGINSLSLKNVMLCSSMNKNQEIEMRVVTPISSYMKWIGYNIKRDALLFDIIS